MEYVKENSKIWDQRSENNDIWSVPVTSDMVKEAREGNWQIVLTPTKPVPANWFPDDLCSKRFYVLQVVVDNRDLYLRHWGQT